MALRSLYLAVLLLSVPIVPSLLLSLGKLGTTSIESGRRAEDASPSPDPRRT